MSLAGQVEARSELGETRPRPEDARAAKTSSSRPPPPNLRFFFLSSASPVFLRARRSYASLRLLSCGMVEGFLRSGRGGLLRGRGRSGRKARWQPLHPNQHLPAARWPPSFRSATSSSSPSRHSSLSSFSDRLLQSGPSRGPRSPTRCARSFSPPFSPACSLSSARLSEYKTLTVATHASFWDRSSLTSSTEASLLVESPWVCVSSPIFSAPPKLAISTLRADPLVVRLSVSDSSTEEPYPLPSRTSGLSLLERRVSVTRAPSSTESCVPLLLLLSLTTSLVRRRLSTWPKIAVLTIPHVFCHS